MGMMKEFKEFAVRGNVVDMAVGIIIGAAFGKIVSSLVADVVMPPIGLALGGVDFADLAITLKAATETSEPVVIAYGKFLQTAVDFLLVACAVFLLVKGINSLKRQAEEAPPAPRHPPPKKYCSPRFAICSSSAELRRSPFRAPPHSGRGPTPRRTRARRANPRCWPPGCSPRSHHKY